MNTVILRKLLRQSGYITLISLVLIMIMWPFFQDYLGKIDKMSILGVVVGIIAAFIGYFDEKISAILELEKNIKNMSIGSAVREAIKIRGTHIKELRLRALTGETMLPILKDVPCYIEKCYLMLHEYDKFGPISDCDELNRHVQLLLRRWQALVHAGKIGTLEVAYYKQFPGDFVMLFDDEVMVNGLFSSPDGTPAGAEFFEPVVVINTGVETGKWIYKHIKCFDIAFLYWKHSKECDGSVSTKSRRRFNDCCGGGGGSTPRELTLISFRLPLITFSGAPIPNSARAVPR